MSDTAQIWLPEAKSTQSCGASLARTIYDLPVTVLLSGELGAGKTTFLQGFARGLDIAGHITSPTFALEQRYPLTHHSSLITHHQSEQHEFIHTDLYRLTARQAQELLRSTDDFRGIRCIEWPERAERAWDEPTIAIHLSEENDGRRCIVAFKDAPLPTRSMIEQWRKEFHLPLHIAAHCDAVADFAEKLSGTLSDRRTIVRKQLLRRSAEMHDLFRFLDFRPGGHTNDNAASLEETATWEEVRKRYPDLRHEPACARFLQEQGFDAVAAVVAVHGLTLPSPPRRTVEQQLLFYADKRLRIDEVVSLDERFADFRKRYGQGKQSEEHHIWYREALSVEAELFPDGCPL